MKIAAVIVGTFTLVAGGWLVRNNRPFVEEAPYEVVTEKGAFEIRSYPPLPVATVTGDEEGAFRKLFGYIDEGNSAREKIAMTAPVFMEAERMSFVLPAENAERGLPEPEDDAVRIEMRPALEAAVYRFSGYTGADREREAAATLRDWMAAEGLDPIGEPVFAYYDAPWTPPSLRRNEVMFRIDRAAAESIREKKESNNE